MLSNLEKQNITILLEKENIKILWYLKRSPFAEDNSSIRSIAASVIANEVGKMEGKDVCKYSLKRS